jgi:hypothetical protein
MTPLVVLLNEVGVGSKTHLLLANILRFMVDFRLERRLVIIGISLLLGLQDFITYLLKFLLLSLE